MAGANSFFTFSNFSICVWGGGFLRFLSSAPFLEIHLFFNISSVMGQVKTTIEVITPQIAEEYLKHNSANRTLNNSIVSYYARMIRDGQWTLNGESIVFDENGNLIDGQHRLNAVIEANFAIKSIVVRNVDCKSFTTIDTGKARSVGDAFSINGIQNSTRVSSGIRKYIMMCRMNIGSLRTLNDSGGNSMAKVSTIECLDEYNSRPDFWQREALFGASCYERCRLISCIDVAAISAYLQLQKGYLVTYIHDFFSQLFFEEKTKNGTLALFRRMVVNDAMCARGIRMTQKHKTQLLIKCWNAYKSGKELKRLSWNQDAEKELTFE